MSQIRQVIPMPRYLARLVYLFMIILSFYLLFLSRAGEVYTVWEVMNPTFMPVFFSSTLILIAIIFSSEKTSYKLLFIILHSILSHTLFVIIFPAGNIGAQQMMLGRTRLIYDNVILNGWPSTPAQSIFGQMYNWFRGTNFQAALTIIFARMLNIDIYWVHLLLVPILNATSIPTALFMITKTFIQKDKVSILSSLLISFFPPSIVWGTCTVPNSIGYIFFSLSLIFLLKYLSSTDPKTILVMTMFSFVSFLAHFLTGIVTFTLLILGLSFKKYRQEKTESPTTAKIFLLTSFIFCASLLPTALSYLKLFYPMYTYFTTEKLYQLSTSELTSILIFGEQIEFQLSTLLIHIAGSLVGLASMLYILTTATKQTTNTIYRICIIYLFTAFLIFLVDHRILVLFMTGVPFAAGRLFVFQYVIVTPFIAIVAHAIITFLQQRTSNALRRIRVPSFDIPPARTILKCVLKCKKASALLIMYIFALASISGWITLSLYRAYPHYAPLQTTSYELEAVKCIEQNTTERYIVICDQWITWTGEMFVGLNNPRAFYFSSTDPKGVALFIEMKRNVTSKPMMEAMKFNNATTAYFIIEKPRLGTQEYNRITQKAQQNNLQIYRVFYYKGEEKLRIFYYKSNTST